MLDYFKRVCLYLYLGCGYDDNEILSDGGHEHRVSNYYLGDQSVHFCTDGLFRVLVEVVVLPLDGDGWVAALCGACGGRVEGLRGYRRHHRCSMGTSLDINRHADYLHILSSPAEAHNDGPQDKS